MDLANFYGVCVEETEVWNMYTEQISRNIEEFLGIRYIKHGGQLSRL